MEDKRKIILAQEGYGMNGQHQPNSIVGTYLAIDLEDAVKQFASEHPNCIIEVDKNGVYSEFGCKLYEYKPLTIIYPK